MTLDSYFSKQEAGDYVCVECSLFLSYSVLYAEFPCQNIII